MSGPQTSVQPTPSTQVLVQSQVVAGTDALSIIETGQDAIGVQSPQQIQQVSVSQASQQPVVTVQQSAPSTVVQLPGDPASPQAQNTFETWSKNLKATNAVVVRDITGRIQKLYYPDANGIAKTLLRDANNKLTQITLSGGDLGTTVLTKNILRDANGRFAGINYT